MTNLIDAMNGIVTINEETNNWSAHVFKNVNHLSSIMKMIDNSQSDLLQAQIDLQDGQNQIRKLESILQLYNTKFETMPLLYYCNDFQCNKNNDQESNKIIELQNEITLVQNDNWNVKKHLENVFLSNSQLQNGIDCIKNEMKKKDQLIKLSNEEIKKNNLEKKELEAMVNKLTSEINLLKLKCKEKINGFKSKLHSKEFLESKSVFSSEELLKKIKEYEVIIKDQENKIFMYSDKCELMETKAISTKQIFFKEMQQYELKVREIIDELKCQKENLEEQSNELVKELASSKTLITEINESNRQMIKKLEKAEEETQILKLKLLEKCQLEDREKLLKRELDENFVQIRNYKSQIVELNLEKEKYFNRNREQDVAIRHLLDEIKSLHNQLIIMKQQSMDQNAWNESVSTNSIAARPNLSTPISHSTTEGLDDQTQSLTNYIININNRSIDNIGDNENFKLEETDIVNNSEFDSLEENTVQKLTQFLRKDHSDYLHSKDSEIKKESNDDGHLIITDEFSKYLEEQLRLIKIAGAKNLALIKRELTLN